MPPELVSVHQDVESIQQMLRESLGPRRYERCFGPSTRLEVEGAELVIHVSVPYLAKWIQQKFGTALNEVIFAVLGPEATIRFEIGQEIQFTPAVAHGTKGFHGDHVSRDHVKMSVARTTSQPAVNPKRNTGRRCRSLSEFVIGESNELAMAAVQQVVADPGEVSPLYLHAAVGNGKSHLLEGIRLRLRREAPQLQVVLLTAEQFANYYTQALGAKSLASFRQRFRSVDVLLIDDVDFFDGKKGFQEEFLHTVKQFEEAGRQIVVTANRHPRLLTKSIDELTSRFAAGLVCRLEKPELKTRLEIVRRHAQKHSCQLPPATIEFVAEKFTSNARELEGAVNILATWGQMTQLRVTVTAARKLLSQLERDCMKFVKMADIELVVCSLFGIAEEDLKSKTRKQSIAQPRMLAMYLSRKLTQTPYSEIGKYYGGRNHSTVMSAERKIDEQLQQNGLIQIASETWELQDLIETLKDRILAG